MDGLRERKKESCSLLIRMETLLIFRKDAPPSSASASTSLARAVSGSAVPSPPVVANAAALIMLQVLSRKRRLYWMQRSELSEKRKWR